MNALLFTFFLAVLAVVCHGLAMRHVGDAMQQRMMRQAYQARAESMHYWQQLYAQHYHPKRRMWRFLRRTYGLDYHTLFGPFKPDYPQSDQHGQISGR